MLKYRLKGLAETVIEEQIIYCPECEEICFCESDEDEVDDINSMQTNAIISTEGIIVVCKCDTCGMSFIPKYTARVLDHDAFYRVLVKDSVNNGNPLIGGLDDVKLLVEKENFLRNYELA